MNFCTKCASYYQVAGTCNCYAQTQPVVNPQPLTPGYPQTIPFYPTYPNYTPWWGIYPPPAASIPTVWSSDAFNNPPASMTVSCKPGEPVKYIDAAGNEIQWSYTKGGEVT